MTNINDTDIRNQLEQLSSWNLVEDIWIKREYKFKTFVKAMKFVNAVAIYAEEENHHPFISINYNIVILKLTSLEKRALTALDIEMAKYIDRLYKKGN